MLNTCSGRTRKNMKKPFSQIEIHVRVFCCSKKESGYEYIFIFRELLKKCKPFSRKLKKLSRWKLILHLGNCILNLFLKQNCKICNTVFTFRLWPYEPIDKKCRNCEFLEKVIILEQQYQDTLHFLIIFSKPMQSFTTLPPFYRGF